MMTENTCWDDGCVRTLEAEPSLIATVMDVVTPEAATTVGIALLALGMVGLLSGKNIMMKMGPLVLSIA